MAAGRSTLFPEHAPYPAIQTTYSKRGARRGFVQRDCIRRAETAWDEAYARPGPPDTTFFKRRNETLKKGPPRPEYGQNPGQFRAAQPKSEITDATQEVSSRLWLRVSGYQENVFSYFAAHDMSVGFRPIDGKAKIARAIVAGYGLMAEPSWKCKTPDHAGIRTARPP